MAETRGRGRATATDGRSRPATKRSQRKAKGSDQSPARASESARGSTAPRRSKPAGEAGARSSEKRNNGMATLDAVMQARAQLSRLLGRPVEAILGVDRDHGSWVVTAQVVELSRIPNTTDVLGEYEAIVDAQGEIVRYRRTHRYHRGHVDGDQS